MWSVHRPAIDLAIRRVALGAVCFACALALAQPQQARGEAKVPIAKDKLILPLQKPAVVGEWGPVMKWPVIATHVSLLPNGKVLLWPRTTGPDGVPLMPPAIRDPRLWDPHTNVITKPPVPPYNVFCSSHSFLADGRLFVAGGHIRDGVGEPKSCIYDFQQNKWTEMAKMNAGRWYPACLTLHDGNVLVVGGDIANNKDNPLPQVFDHATHKWHNLTGAEDIVPPNYAFLHVAPNGKAFMSGPGKQTAYLDTSGKGKWTVVGDRIFGQRDYGSSVMYEPGKVLTVGGGDPPTNSAEVIDLNVAKPKWHKTDPMHVKRRQMNATLLPDGTVFASGGSSAGGFSNPAGATLTTELWDPHTGHWTPMAPQAERRLYHSTVILLPDGKLLSAGGGEPPYGLEGGDSPHRNAQIYSPPYLFKGPRPVISNAPTAVSYGKHFEVKTADAKHIHKVTWVRLSSTTHAQNFNQRINFLTFKESAGSLTVTAPPNCEAAPPGHYLMFILNEHGVPSVAKFVHIS